MSTLMAVLLLFLAAAHAQTITVVSNCSAMAGAFQQLQDRFENATRSTALSLNLTLDCAADWSGCSTNARFEPSRLAISRRQPKVTITVETNCAPGQNMTIPNTLQEHLFLVYTYVLDVAVSMTVSGPGLTVIGPAVGHYAKSGTKSALAVKGVSVLGGVFSGGVLGWGVDTMSVAGGLFQNVSQPVFARRVSNSVTVQNATFNGTPGNSIGADLTKTRKVVLTDNTFTAVTYYGFYQIRVDQQQGRINLDMSRNTFDNSSSFPICVESNFLGTRAQLIKVAGSIGITPTVYNRTMKPSGWPVGLGCRVAAFFTP